MLLPVPVLIVIPGLILYFFDFRCSSWSDWQLYPAILLSASGLLLAVWTVTLFSTVGKGTPAPWDPPQKLVVSGPYRYVRNPMLSGVFLVLLAETLYFQSYGIALWFAVFLIANMLYFPLFEEPGLRRRFGAEYEEYCRSVPRFIPRPSGKTNSDFSERDNS
jgi:protein-S-isoprenylcysteine O-methyltransferase Ste14